MAPERRRVSEETERRTRVEEFLATVSGFVWGPFLLIPLLLLTGLYLTIILRGLQFRQLGPALYLALIKTP